MSIWLWATGAYLCYCVFVHRYNLLPAIIHSLQIPDYNTTFLLIIGNGHESSIVHIHYTDLLSTAQRMVSWLHCGDVFAVLICTASSYPNTVLQWQWYGTNEATLTLPVVELFTLGPAQLLCAVVPSRATYILIWWYRVYLIAVCFHFDIGVCA